MTPPRAALIRIIDRYCARALEVSIIEVQKLLYFLQDAGEPLGLGYVKGYYGPYADNLRHALIKLEGHYLVGFGDGSAKVLDAESLSLLPGATDTADRTLADQPGTTGRIDRVLALADGFETPYGMELLASVHWIATHEATRPTDPDQISRLVRAWTPRKGRMFTDEHPPRPAYPARTRLATALRDSRGASLTHPVPGVTGRPRRQVGSPAPTAVERPDDPAQRPRGHCDRVERHARGARHGREAAEQHRLHARPAQQRHRGRVPREASRYTAAGRSSAHTRAWLPGRVLVE